MSDAVRKKPVNITDEMAKTAYELLLTGATYAWAAQFVGCSAGGLRHALQLRGMHVARSPRRSKYTSERARRLEQLVAQGISLTNAAAKCNISHYTLCKWRAAGLIDVDRCRHRYRKYDDDAIRRIYARYTADAELSVRQIATLYKIDYGHLLLRWRKLGLMVDKGRSARQRAMNSRRSSVDLDALARAWREYQSNYVNAKAIVQQLHMSWVRICSIWTDMGYDVRRVVKRKYDNINGTGAYDKARSSGEPESI